MQHLNIGLHIYDILRDFVYEIIVYKYITYYMILFIKENCLKNRAKQGNQRALIRKNF